MATYESIEETTVNPVSIDIADFLPVVLQELDNGKPIMLKTRTELIEGTLPTSKGGTGISKLDGKRLIASNTDGSSLEEVDVLIEHLAGLNTNVQKKLDSIRSYQLSLSTEEWSTDDIGYYKEVEVLGILPTDNPLIGLSISSTTTDDIETEKYSYSCIDKIDTDTDKVIIHCFDETPTTDINLVIVCIS